MITEAQYIAYFASLAAAHLQISNGVGGRQSFFYIPVASDLTEIDNALRSKKATPLMALDAMSGVFDEGQSDRFLQTIDVQFTILDVVTVGGAETIRAAHDTCLKIGLEILGRMKNDARYVKTQPQTHTFLNNLANFTITGVQYDPVGPMAEKHYGYTFRCRITCPFGYVVNSSIWSDK